MPHDFSIGDWLKNGWILELAEDSVGGGSDVVIGGGSRAVIRPSEVASAQGAVWTPDFFEAVEASESPRPWRSSWVLKIEREALIDKILTHIGSGKIENNTRRKRRPTCKVVWTEPNRSEFEGTFQRLQKSFREEGVKKAVPVVFSTGQAATSQRETWLADRVLSGLEATRSSNLRIYGSWSQGEGFLGATPEILFSLQGETLVSMAVAGTRALVDESLGDAAKLEVLKRELEADPKERHEHELVVSDIENVMGRESSSVVKSQTRTERFGQLLHLVTDIEGKIPRQRESVGDSNLLEKLVKALHPTPALGVSPRDSSLRLLRELDVQAKTPVARKNFGAPFIVSFENTVHALVSIRQIRWSFRGNDQVDLVLGSGCGVVPESDLEKEWSELTSKRSAVAGIFRLTPEAPRPVLWSLSTMERLVDLGVRTFIVCAGARNAPLVVALDAVIKQQATPLLRMESFFEERAAAFYALGLARGSGRPVAVVTTSGTAATELLPAIAEADSSGVPLIAVTADRPHRLRGTGAPQSIPQQDLFSNFAEAIWDVEVGDALVGLERLSLMRPFHINMAFEEPLLRDAEKEPARVARFAKDLSKRLISKSQSSDSNESTALTRSTLLANDLTTAFFAMREWLSRGTPDGANGGRVAVVAGLHETEREAVVDFLVAHQIPSLLEGTSGLRGDSRLKSLEFIGGEKDLIRWCASGDVHSLLRIGGVPTTRLWRDLDEPDLPVETLSISRLRFQGMSRGGLIELSRLQDWNDFFANITPKSATPRSAASERLSADWFAKDQASAQKLETALRSMPQSEPAFVRRLSELISENDLVYVGNSLPIRWWDLAATRERCLAVEANRGVNGIDGQISTALGLVKARESVRRAWILVGDLTALYDLSAPWALLNEVERETEIRIVILNNSGGRIFSRVLAKAPSGSAPFENAHDIGFEHWAKMWNLDYHRVCHSDELAKVVSGGHCVIELIPEAASTERFWTEIS